MTPAELDGIVLPRYGEDSLGEVLPSVLGALGVRGETDVLGLPPAERYCVLLVDGLGWRQLNAHPSLAPFLTSMRGRPITAGVPTTTAASLTSLGTGLPPGRHGVVGYTTRLPGTKDAVFNALKWDKSVDPDSYQPHPTLFERAARAGVAVTVLGEREFKDSGLTRAGLRSAGFRVADTPGVRVALAQQACEAAAPSLVYVYDGDLDYTGHQAGWRSDAWRYQLAFLDGFVEQLHAALPDGTVLLVTADHGMVDVAADKRVDVDDVPDMYAGVDLVAGEPRFRHLYTADGAAGDVRAAWDETLGDRAVALSREDAVAAGWFGAVESRVLDRIGDVVVAVNGDCAVERRHVFPVEGKLVGLHGALTADEMLIPLLTLPA